MSPATTARTVAGLDVCCGRPTATQWVAILARLANAPRTLGHTLHVAFADDGAARITQHPFRKVAA